MVRREDLAIRKCIVVSANYFTLRSRNRAESNGGKNASTKDSNWCRKELCLAVLFSSKISETRSRMKKAECDDWFTSYVADSTMLVGAE